MHIIIIESQQNKEIHIPESVDLNKFLSSFLPTRKRNKLRLDSQKFNIKIKVTIMWNNSILKY